MQFQKLEFQGFRQFGQKKTINFGQGINVIIGKNETGKSTILEALLSAIYRSRTRSMEPLLPWTDQSVCETRLTYVIDKTEYTITRDYVNQKDNLFETKTKKTIQNKEKIAEIVANHFGISDEKVFKNTTFIAQNQIEIANDQTTQSKFSDAFLNQSQTEEESFSKIEKNITKKIKQLEEQKEELEQELEEIADKIPSSEQYHNQKKGHQIEMEKLENDLKEKKERLKYLQKLFEENQTKEKIQQKHDNHDNRHKEIMSQKNDLETELKQLEQTSTVQQIQTFTLADYLLAIAALILALTIIGLIIAIPIAIYLYKKHKRAKTNLNQSILPLQMMETKRNKLKELIQKEAEIFKQLAITQNQLDLCGANPFDDGNRYELESLTNELSKTQQKYSKLIGQVETLNEINIDPTELKEKQEYYTNQLNEIEMKKRAYKMASEYLEASYEELQSQLTPKLNQETSQLIQQITSNKYSQIIFNDINNIQIVDPKTNTKQSIDHLSQGTKDQIYLTIRIIVAKEIAGKIIPLIFDDPFHTFDKERLANTMELLKKISKKQQIILVSHDEDYTKYADSIIRV